MQYDNLVFIGRFEPFHNAHQTIIRNALKLSRKVIVLVGSTGKPRTIKNPWNLSERTVMVRHCFSAEENARIAIAGVHDHPYSDQAWAAEVQRAVGEMSGKDEGARTGIVGHIKDDSTYYLKMFPQWKLVEVPNIAGLSATDIRGYFLDAGSEGGDILPASKGNRMLIQSAVPGPVFEFLESFRNTPHYAPLVRESQFVNAYRSQFAGLRYPIQFITTDAVVVHSGHLLLVQRKAAPGKGLWALPGGFVGERERIEDACLRELAEETRLKLPEKVLRGSIKAEEVFDDPDRSLRGRTITRAYYFEFPAGELPPVRGGDDAEKAKWVPLAQFEQMEEHLFEDHYHIAKYFLRQV
jgi:bifunctional NMN adenylyltransferase/nudix hydrolase